MLCTTAPYGRRCPPDRPVDDGGVGAHERQRTAARDGKTDGQVAHATVKWGTGSYEMTDAGGNGTCVTHSSADKGKYALPEKVKIELTLDNSAKEGNHLVRIATWAICANVLRQGLEPRTR